MSITHEIYKPFDEGYEVRCVFLNISKAFDKILHNGIIFKLPQNGMSGNLLKLLRNFLSEQRVVLDVTAGVPQDSVLGP